MMSASCRWRHVEKWVGSSPVVEVFRRSSLVRKEQPPSSAARWIAGALVAVCLHGSMARSAETITRRRDKPISGEVVEVSRTEVTVKVKTPKEETVRVPAIEIQSISWAGEPPEANLARSDDAGGRYQRAIDGYEKSLQSGKSGGAQSKIDLEYGVTRGTARLALTDPARIDDALKRLEEFRSRHGEHYRYYEAVGLLGRLYLAKKDFAKARSAFDALAKSPWKETQLAARIATGRLLQADSKPDEALAAFSAVIDEIGEGREESSLRQEALLGKAQVLVSQRKYDLAQTLLEQIIDQAEADDAKVMAEAYVRLGDCLREQGKEKEAMFAYLHVDVLFASEKPLEAEALFHLTRLFEKAGQKARAAEFRDKLEGEEFKNSEWARQLKSPAG